MARAAGEPVSRWAAWQCPQCGHEEQQLTVAVAVGHRCKRVRRVVELVREQVELVREQGV